jgi:putative tricarboxylic transport membrane protein
MQYFSQGTGLVIWALLLLLLTIATGLAFHFTRRKQWTGQALIPTTLIALALLFWAITFDFPSEEAGPALIPRLWILCLVGICSTMLFFIIRGQADKDPAAGRIGFVLVGIGCMVAYFFAIQFLGYFISSVIFLAIMMYLLSCRNPMIIVLVSAGWLVFSYVVFYKLLYIQLPLGFIENYL